MDDSLYLFCSGLVIAALVWLFNPFGKLENLLGCLLNSGSAELPDGVRSFDDMPGPKGWPFFGDIFSYFYKDSTFKQQVALLKSNFAKYGPIFKRTIMGRTVVSIQNPEDVEIVIKADGRYPMRPKLVFKVVEEYSKSRGRPKAIVLR